MSPTLINLGGLPGLEMEPETIRSGAVRLRATGSAVATASAGVVKTWQLLAPAYKAPESGRLLSAMDPVKSSGATLSEHFASAATALETFANEVEAIKQSVAAIQADALAFFATIRGGKSTVTVHDTRNGDTAKQVDWWDDPAAAQQNNALVGRATAQAELLSAAEDRCFSTLMGLAEGALPGSENGGPGYWTGPPAWTENPPWGAPVDVPEMLEDPVGKGLKKKAYEAAATVLGLAGWNTSNFHYDLDKTAAEQGPMRTGSWSWHQLVQARVDIVKSVVPFLKPSFTPDLTLKLTGAALLIGAAVSGRPVEDAKHHPWAGLIGSTVAIEDWKDHPWTALTETVINVGGLVIGGPELGGAKAASEASHLSAAAREATEAAAATERAAETARLAKIAEDAPKTPLPTVVGHKVIEAGEHLDDSLRRTVDRLEVDMKVPDHEVVSDRVNAPDPTAPHPRAEDPAVRSPADHAVPRTSDGRAGVPERELVHSGAPERPSALERSSGRPGVGSTGTDSPRATPTSSGSGAGAIHDLSADRGGLPEDRAPAHLPDPDHAGQHPAGADSAGPSGDGSDGTPDTPSGIKHPGEMSDQPAGVEQADHPGGGPNETTATDQGAGGTPAPHKYSAAIFGDSNLGRYTGPTPTLGPKGGTFFVMSGDDVALVHDAASAARYTGMSPSTLKAYQFGGDIHAILFPAEHIPHRVPTRADAGPWPHYLEGGYTAVLLEGPKAGYLVNPVREFVIDGGRTPPPGSVLVTIEGDYWKVVRRW